MVMLFLKDLVDLNFWEKFPSTFLMYSNKKNLVQWNGNLDTHAYCSRNTDFLVNISEHGDMNTHFM